MISKMKNTRLRILAFLLSFLFIGSLAFAADTDFPERPSPPRLVNDLAHSMSPEQVDQLEQKVLGYNRSSSCQIAIVTVNSIGDYDASDYAIKLGKLWGIGEKGKDNGVVILLSIQDRKEFIAPGKGMEGSLTDMKCGQIRDKMIPFLKQKDYAAALNEAADDVIAVTKGEFKADPRSAHAQKTNVPLKAIIVIIIIIFFIIRMSGRGGGGGGNYISGGGIGNIATGFFLGNLLGGGGRGGWGGGEGGGGGDSGGFGGFGGGDFGGGGAGGSW